MVAAVVAAVALSLVVAETAFAAPPGGTAAATAERPRTNVVLILVDDMGFSDIGATGGEIATPSLDRLAAEGQLWTQFYNNAKCTITRAAILTGRYPRLPEPHLHADMPTVAETLAEAGYRTIHSGKWHLGGRAPYLGSEPPYRPSDRGFARYYGLLDGCCNYFDPSRPDPKFKGGRVRNLLHDDTPVTEFADDYFTTDAFTDYACDEIAAAAHDGEPFFLHLCYTAPHYPLHARPETIAKYRGQYVAGWGQLRAERFARQHSLGLVDERWTLPAAADDVPDWDGLDPSLRDYYDHLMATYAAMVQEMDAGVGRVLQTLDETGKAESTLVVFLSDNGGCSERPGGIDPMRTPGVKEHYTAVDVGWAYAQNTPYRRYKQWTHEGGIKTPMIARWPGRIEPGSRRAEVGHIIDLHPTFAAVAGVTPLAERAGVAAAPVDGVTLVDAFGDDGPVVRTEPLFWSWQGAKAVRDGDWKAVAARRSEGDREGWALYDLASDPTEVHDRSRDEPERLRAMIEQWVRWNETRVRIAPSE